MSVEPVHPLSGSFSPAGAAAWAGARFPPGAHVDGHAVTFAVYSRHATRVLLEIYEHPLGEPRRFDYWMAWGGDGWWRASIADVPVGTLYGFRCWGPNWDYADGWARGNSSAGFVCDVDAHGNRFNPNKLLFDPYARELSHDRETPAMKDVHGHHAAMYGSGPGPYRGVDDRIPPVPTREFDTGPWAPKAVVVHDDTPVGTRPRVGFKPQTPQ